jgi:PAS domain S-box-containing protein
MGENARLDANISGSFDHFKLLTENSAAGIYILYGDHFLYVNQQMADIHGYSLKEMTENKFWDFVHPEFLDKVKQRGRDRQNGKEVSSRFELKIITKSGETKWVELVANQARIEDKYVVLGTVLDVTERHIMSESVIHNSRLQKLLADISSDFINVNPENVDNKINTLLSLSGRFIDADRSYLFEFIDNGKAIKNTHEWCIDDGLSIISDMQYITLRDYPWMHQQFLKNELLSIPIVDNLPDHAKKEKELFKQQQIKSLYTFPIILNDKIFGFFGFDYVTKHYKWDQSQIQFFKVITEIISNAFERINSERNVRYHQNLQELLIRLSTRFINLPAEEIDDGIAESLSELGQFVQADRAYIFDYDFEKNISVYSYEWCNDGVSPEIDNHTILPLELGTEMVKYHLSGHYFLIPDVEALPDRDLMKSILSVQGVKSMVTFPMVSDNDCLGFVGFDSVNRTHHYSEKEKQLLEVFAQMLVNIRVRYDLQNNLIKAKQDAELASQHKSAFLANMSHEIRTPIHGIVGFIDLLLNTNLSEEQKEYLKNAKASSENLVEIINDILDFSKIEAGKLEINESEVDITEIIHETANILKPITNQKKIKLEVDIDENTPAFLELDSLRFKQILMNLLSNALKFTDDGKIQIKLNFDRLTPESGTLRVDVSDTGIGISENERDKIFKAFTQADSTITKKYGGTGLGLVISSSLVEKMGGTIGFDSTPGVGSNFYFTITKKYGDGSTTVNQESVNIQHEIDEKIKFNKTVMIVEDVDMNALLIKTILNKNLPNAHVIEAKNGKKAVELYKEFTPEIILMDIRMPLMNGYQATREIRKIESTSGNKSVIIALTAEAVKSELDKCIESGMDDFITKPIHTKKFLAMLHKYSGHTQTNSDETNYTTTPDIKAPTLVHHFDRDALLDRVGGDHEFAEQMVTMGIQEIETKLPALNAASEDQNWAELIHLAHSLKGLSRSISFVVLGNHFEKLEMLSKSDNPNQDKVKNYIQTIEIDFNFTREMDFF